MSNCWNVLETDSQCYSFIADGYLWFVYRGTECKIRDILTDIQIKKMVVPFPKMRKNTKIRGYKGFLKGYLSLQDIIHETIQWEFSKKELKGAIHTGHSLGGALAFWSILDCTFRFPGIKNGGCSFGAPKNGNKALARSFDKRVINFIRLKNWLDPVTGLPIFGRHSKRKVRLQAVGHDIDNYINAVKKM